MSDSEFDADVDLSWRLGWRKDVMMKFRCWSCSAVAATFFCGPVSAAEIGPTDDLESAAAALSPGEELVLRGGTYLFDGNVTITANDTAQQPIIIRAKDGEQPILEQQTVAHNVIEINGSSHLVVSGIEFTGGSHGIRLINSDYITIQDCEIHEIGDVAISANAGGGLMKGSGYCGIIFTILMIPARACIWAATTTVAGW